MSRDMTDRQFVRAARRNGFEPVLDLYLQDTIAPEGDRVCVGNIFGGTPRRLLKRASLANALRRRAERLEKARKKA